MRTTVTTPNVCVICTDGNSGYRLSLGRSTLTPSQPPSAKPKDQRKVKSSIEFPSVRKLESAFVRQSARKIKTSMDYPAGHVAHKYSHYHNPWEGTLQTSEYNENMLEVVRQRLRSSHPTKTADRQQSHKKGTMVWLDGVNMWISEDDYKFVPYLNFVHKLKTADLEKLHQKHMSRLCSMKALECPRHLSHNHAQDQAKSVLEELHRRAEEMNTEKQRKHQDMLSKRRELLLAAKKQETENSIRQKSDRRWRMIRETIERNDNFNQVLPVNPDVPAYYAESWGTEEDMAAELELAERGHMRSGNPQTKGEVSGDVKILSLPPDAKRSNPANVPIHLQNYHSPEIFNIHRKNLLRSSTPQPLTLSELRSTEQESGETVQALDGLETSKHPKHQQPPPPKNPTVFPNFYVPKSKTFTKQKAQKEQKLSVSEKIAKMFVQHLATAAARKSADEDNRSVSHNSTISEGSKPVEKIGSEEGKQTADTLQSIEYMELPCVMVEKAGDPERLEEKSGLHPVSGTKEPNITETSQTTTEGSLVQTEGVALPVITHTRHDNELITLYRMTKASDVVERATSSISVVQPSGEQPLRDGSRGDRRASAVGRPSATPHSPDECVIPPRHSSAKSNARNTTLAAKVLTDADVITSHHFNSAASASAVGSEKLPEISTVEAPQTVSFNQQINNKPKKRINRNRRAGELTAAASNATPKSFKTTAKKSWIFEDSGSEILDSERTARSRSDTEMSFDIRPRSTTSEMVTEPFIIGQLEPVEEPKLPSTPTTEGQMDEPQFKAKKSYGKANIDFRVKEELERQRVAEERKRKAMKMRIARMTVMKPVLNRADSKDNISEFSGVSGSWLDQYCIYATGAKDVYKNVFTTLLGSTSDKPDPLIDKLTLSETLMGLNNVNRDLRSLEAEYIIRVTELMGYNLRNGCDIRHFSLMAALSHKITTLDEYMRSTIIKSDMKRVDARTFLCKRLWETTQDPDTNMMSPEKLMIELKAGGISPKHEDEVKRSLASHNRSLDFLDFLTYVPLFAMIHHSVVTNPLDDTRVK